MHIMGAVSLCTLTTAWLDLINNDPWSDKWVTEWDNDTSRQQRICWPQRERGGRVEAQCAAPFACLRCSGQYGTFPAHCVHCHQATNHSTRAQYLCFLTVYTLHTSTRTGADGRWQTVNVIIKTTWFFRIRDEWLYIIKRLWCTETTLLKEHERKTVC